MIANAANAASSSAPRTDPTTAPAIPPADKLFPPPASEAGEEAVGNKEERLAVESGREEDGIVEDAEELRVEEVELRREEEEMRDEEGGRVEMVEKELNPEPPFVGAEVAAGEFS